MISDAVIEKSQPTLCRSDCFLRLKTAPPSHTFRRQPTLLFNVSLCTFFDAANLRVNLKTLGSIHLREITFHQIHTHYPNKLILTKPTTQAYAQASVL